MKPSPPIAGFSIRPMASSEASEVAQLIFESTNHWYESKGFGKIFQGQPEDCLVFPQVYEDLDPGCCLVAVAVEDQRLIGSCFYHPRESHYSLGIMNTLPDSGRKGVAKALLSKIVDLSRQAEKPLRLVSSAFNLDSFSLYTRQGFAPYAVFQDMYLAIPSEGIPIDPLPGVTARAGQPADIDAIADLERTIWQTSRRKDWQYFQKNARDIWSLTVAQNSIGTIVGALASVNHPGCQLLGPGLAIDSNVATLLIQTELNRHRGRSPVLLAPSDRKDLVRRLYQMGGRNCELHFAQCLGKPPPIDGVVLPTFMPETG